MVSNRRNVRYGPSAGLRRCFRGAQAVALLLLLTGCYSLVPVNPEAITPPVRVRAHLTPEAAERVAPIFGQPRASFDGRLVERAPGGFYVEVRAGEVQQGFGSEILTQRLLLAPGDLLGLQHRQLDRARTGLLAGGVAVLLGAVIYDMISGDAGGTTTAPPTGGPPESRIPLLTLPVR